MDLKELWAKVTREEHLFDPSSYGRILACVDFANVWYWSKSFWPEDNKEFIKRGIDVQKVCELINTVEPVQKFFYYGHYKEHAELPYADPKNVAHRKSIYRLDLARKCGFTPRTKVIKEIRTFNESGKFIGILNKCNFDVEITMELMRKIETYDTVLLWSGDSDFNPLMQYLKYRKKKVVTVCARDSVSTDLDSGSSLFIPADPFKDLLEYMPKSGSK